MITGRPLQPWRHGKSPTARDMNAIQGRLSPLSQISVNSSQGAVFLQTATGTAINAQHRHIIPTPAGGVVAAMPALITGSSLLSVTKESAPQGAPVAFDRRWSYAWSEVEFFGALGSDDGDLYRTKRDGISGLAGTESGAINLNEMVHIKEPHSSAGWVNSGVDEHGAAYPDNFSMKPIGGGGTGGSHVQNVMVWMHLLATTDGTARYVFDKVNSHDGIC